MDEMIKAIGRRIRAYRNALDMTQEELAQRLGYTSRSSIARIENGKMEMPLSKMGQCADILGVDFEVLVFGKK